MLLLMVLRVFDVDALVVLMFATLAAAMLVYENTPPKPWPNVRELSTKETATQTVLEIERTWDGMANRISVGAGSMQRVGRGRLG